MKAVSELVTLFLDKDGEITGLLHENGKREIYKVSRATKADVQKILDVDINTVTV